MNSVLAAPFETISFGQDAPRYSGAWRPKRHDLGLVPPVDPNAAVDPIVATDSHAFAGNIDRLVTREMGSLGYLTMDVAEGLESFYRFVCLEEGMGGAAHGHVFISTWVVKPAPIPPIETLADRSRAAIDELTKLDPGWDGYDGSPVLPRVARHALRLMEAIGAHTQIVPDVVPLSNGGLQLEWYVGIHEIEVEIAPDCATRLHRECTGDEDPAEVPIGDPHVTPEVAAFFRALRR